MTAFARVLAPGEGDPTRVGADGMLVKAIRLDGTYSVIEYEAAAGMPGPPPHVHHVNEEAFFILQGSVAFALGNDRQLLQPGAFVIVPPGVPHTFANVGDGVARWVGIFAPGRYVQLVQDLAAILPDAGPPDPDALAAVFAGWDSELVG